jgi:serine/threonine protein kinase
MFSTSNIPTATTAPASAVATTPEHSQALLVFPIRFENFCYYYAPAINKVTHITINNDRVDNARLLGIGGRNKVEYFQNHNSYFAVKSPLSLDPSQNTVAYYAQEKQYLEQAYPAFYAVHTTSFNAPSAKNPEKMETLSLAFFVMQYVQGVRLNAIFDVIKNEKWITFIYLVVAQELQRIHSLGILHGDIKNDNILIHHDAHTGVIKATFIDFEWAYRITDPVARCMEFNEGGAYHFAPERQYNPNTIAPKPAFASDVFAIGYTVRQNLENKHFHFQPTCLTNFYIQALSADPTKRPTTQTWITTLQDKLCSLQSVPTPIINSTENTSSTAMIISRGISAEQTSNTTQQVTNTQNKPDADNFGIDEMNYCTSNDASSDAMNIYDPEEKIHYEEQNNNADYYEEQHLAFLK